MYSVTYKIKLKAGKNLSDFKNWLNTHWLQISQWGAQTVRAWILREGDDEFVFCEYMVLDIRRWNRSAVQSHRSLPIRELESFAEPIRITILKLPDIPAPPLDQPMEIRPQ
jgi:hypothetical protein